MFHDYEIRNWEFSPRIYKILAAAGVANLFALLIFAQTSVLTMKGCDSPLVGRVCQVLDTVYIGTKLFGTDREMIDVEYDRTTISDDEEVTFVDVTGITPPISYPEGYFQIANPVEYQAQLDAQNGFAIDDLAGFPSSQFPTTTPYTGGSITDTTPELPKSNPNVIEGRLPSFGSGSGSTVGPRRPRRSRLPAPPKNDGVDDFEDDIADNKTDPKPTPGVAQPVPTPAASPAPDADNVSKEEKFGVYINRRPLTDKAAETIKQVDSKEIKLDTPFRVALVGTLGLAKDGKTVVLKNPKPLPLEKGFRNDPKMEKLVQEWIVAVGDAGWLGYLEKIIEKQQMKPKRVVFLVEQNDSVLVAKISAEQPTPEIAKTLSSGLGTMLAIAAPQTDGDEQVFLRAATTSVEGNSLVLNVNLPKPIVQEMIQRKLAAAKAQPSPGPGGRVGIQSPNNTAQK